MFFKQKIKQTQNRLKHSIKRGSTLGLSQTVWSSPDPFIFTISICTTSHSNLDATSKTWQNCHFSSYLRQLFWLVALSLIVFYIIKWGLPRTVLNIIRYANICSERWTDHSTVLLNPYGTNPCKITIHCLRDSWQSAISTHGAYLSNTESSTQRGLYNFKAISNSPFCNFSIFSAFNSLSLVFSTPEAKFFGVSRFK